MRRLLLAPSLLALAVGACGRNPVGPDGGVPATCEAPMPMGCPDAGMHYADVAPIFTAQCGACHDGTGPQWPLNDYVSIVDWQDQIRSDLRDCTMPPVDAGTRMTPEERTAILSWLVCGYPP